MKIALALLAIAASVAATIPASVVSWTRAHAVVIGGPDSEPGAREARAIRALVQDAQLIGLGEPFHGHAEPLQYRNRLIRHLVRRGDLTAIALESGIADTEPANDYINGGPGNARAAVSAMSWGFGRLAANVELAEWLRRWNDAHPQAQVRLYGVDVSGGTERGGFEKARSVLDRLDAHLARSRLQSATPLRSAIAKLAPRFSPDGYAAASPTERAAIEQLPALLANYLSTNRAMLVQGTSAEAQARMERIAVDADALVRIFAAWPANPNKPSPDTLRMAEMREAMMTSHTLWALGHEGRRGRVLLFASNGHVAATGLDPVGRPELAGFAPLGARLRRELGGRYRVILFASGLGKAADDAAIGSVDRAFITAEIARALLDIRNAPAWWSARQTLSHGGVRVNAASPKQAADGILYVSHLTAAPSVKASQ